MNEKGKMKGDSVASLGASGVLMTHLFTDNVPAEYFLHVLFSAVGLVFLSGLRELITYWIDIYYGNRRKEDL